MLRNVLLAWDPLGAAQLVGQITLQLVLIVLCGYPGA